MSKPEFIMLVGLPGSGKSTYVNKLLHDAVLENIEYVVISTDDIIEKEAEKAGKTYSDLWKDMIGPATTLANAQFKQALADGKNIIWDQTNVSSKKRKNILAQIPQSYYKTVTVFIVSLETLKQRLTKRGHDTGKFISSNIVNDMNNRFEMPTEKEGFNEINIIGEIC